MSLINHYEELLAIAEKDPEAFEKRRDEILEEYFDSLPEEKAKKARQRQWRLDAELDRAGDDRYNRMVAMFYNGLFAFNDALKGRIAQPTRTAEPEDNVLPFKHK